MGTIKLSIDRLKFELSGAVSDEYRFFGQAYRRTRIWSALESSSMLELMGSELRLHSTKYIGTVEGIQFQGFCSGLLSSNQLTGRNKTNQPLYGQP